MKNKDEEAVEEQAPEMPENEEAADAESESTTDAMIKELEAARSESRDYLAHLQRLQAEFENYRKRISRDHERIIQTAAKKLIEGLLPVLDNFALAIRAADGSDHNSRFVEGIKLVYEDLLSVLSREGLEHIQAAGEDFDPQVHEAVVCEETPDRKQDNKVVEVMREGYKLGGQVLRPAMVKVAKFKE